MSKLTKLINDPRRFILDSRAYRRLALLRDRQELEVAVRLGRTHDDEELLSLSNRAVDMMAKTVPLLDVSEDDLSFSIAVLRQDLHHLSSWLKRAATDPEVQWSLATGTETTDLSSMRLLELDDALARSEVVSLRLARASAPEQWYAIDVELWKTEEGQVVGPRRNSVARRISDRTVRERGLFQAGHRHHARSLYACSLDWEFTLPVDIVFTWVNNRDVGWQELFRSATGSAPKVEAEDSESLDRFMNRDELRYSLRSISEFAPWVRKVFVVTNCAPPPWIDLSRQDIEWVDHHQIIPADHLPTFSSHAIESRLQHVPGLANHFLYFNDDFFLTSPTRPHDFFHPNGLTRSFMESYAVVNGEVCSDDPDYLNAARNGQRLMEEAFGVSPTTLHKHTPYSLSRDTLLEMEDRFAGPIAATTARSFRHPSDISTVSFLYHHYASATGRGTYAGRNAWLVKPHSSNYGRRLSRLLAGASQPVSLCLNDGGGSVSHPHWDAHVREFLAAFFPRPSRFELR